MDRMRVRESMSWDVRVAVAALLAWFAWALVWFVWAARDAGLRSADAHSEKRGPQPLCAHAGARAAQAVS